MAKTKSIGERVRSLRESQGLTHEQLAQKSGLHIDTVIKIQSGLRPDPSASTVLALSRALGVSSEELLGG